MTNPRHPLAVVVLSLLVFLITDNSVFRSGLYSRIANPESVAAQVFNTVRYERDRARTHRREILITGNSRIHWAFWAKQYNDAHPDSDFEFIQCAIAGTYEKMWYFILKVLDPNHDRYDAIIIPTAGYRVDSWSTDQENDYSNIQLLAQILGARSWIDLVSSFEDSDTRARAVLNMTISSDGYAADIQNLIAHPFERIRLLKLRGAAGPEWLADWPGKTGSMVDFRANLESGQIFAFPDTLGLFEKDETIKEFVRPSPEDAMRFTVRNSQYQGRWLGKIIGLYKDSKTKLVFLQMPRSPMALPARGPIAAAPDLRKLLPSQKNVMFIDENAFTDLEQPVYFFDSLHLNSVGRLAFTEELGGRMTRLLLERP